MRPLQLLSLLVAVFFCYPSQAQTAKVQVIHNSPDPAATEVDVYINGGLALDDFAFRTATPYLDLPAGVNLDIAVAPGTSSSAEDALAVFPFTLAAGERYQLIATGVLDPAAFAPNPEGAPTDFTLLVNTPARIGATTDRTKVKVYHGAPDAPEVDVLARGVAKLATFQFPEATNYLRLPVGNYILDVAPAGGAPIASFFAPGATFGTGGQAGLILASGFLNPAANQNGPAFGLLAVDRDGRTRLLRAAPLPSAETRAAASAVTVRGAFPNPFNPSTEIAFSLASATPVTLTVFDVTGREVARLLDGATLDAGPQQVRFDASSLTSGVYVYRLQAGANFATGRLTLLK